MLRLLRRTVGQASESQWIRCVSGVFQPDVERENADNRRFNGSEQHMTNAAAIGYMLIAAKRYLGLDQETIRQLDQAMYRAMDTYTEEEAESEYRNT